MKLDKLDLEELNKNDVEVESVSETVNAKEIVDNIEVEIVSENQDSKEIGTTKDFSLSKKKSNKNLMAIPTTIVGVTSVIVIATSGLVNVQMDGKINQIEYQDSHIIYDINVESLKKDNSIFFVILDENGQNVGEKQFVDLSSYNFNSEGVTQLRGAFEFNYQIIENTLAQKIESNYTIRLCGNTGLVDRTYDSWIVEIDQLISEFYDVTYACKCGVDGCFHFTMNFQDDYCQFSNFSCYLIDSGNHRKDIVLSDNLHKEQKVNVLDLYGGECDFVINYMANGKEETLHYRPII